MNPRLRFPTTVACLALTGISLQAQVPQLIHYQGRLTVAGTNFTGTGHFKFALVGTNQAGAAVTLWSNDGSSATGSEPASAVTLPVDGGLYSVLLGDATLPHMRVVPHTVFAQPAVWLRVWFGDTPGTFEPLAPDQRIAAVGYALMAASAATVADQAITSAQLAPGAVTTDKLASGSVRAGTIAAGQVVKSVNDLRDDVVLAAGTNVSLSTNGNTLIIAAPGGGAGGAGWSLTGNSGTTPGAAFVGTLDAQPLEFRVANQRALRLEPTSTGGLFPRAGTPNVIAGFRGNYAEGSVRGGTIAGGGAEPGLLAAATTNVVGGSYASVGGGLGNRAEGDRSVTAGGTGNVAGGDDAVIAGGADNWVGARYGSIGGGMNNAAGGRAAMVPGGSDNAADGDYSFAAGYHARAVHDGSFVWADARETTFASTATNQFLVRASGGVGLGTDRPQQALSVGGGANVDQDNLNSGSLANGLRFGSTSGEGIASRRTEGANRYGLDFYTASQPRVSFTQGGDVGIGTRTPEAKLDVRGEARFTGMAHFGGTRTVLEGFDSSNYHWFARNPDNDFALGIEWRGPSDYAFHHNGRIICPVIEITGGADVAEPFPVATPGLPRGSVLVIDPDHPGQLKPSDRAYDRQVAGVVSGANGVQPGLTLRQAGLMEGTENIALSGRVYVLADARETPVRPGDLLTTAATPGHAMTATDLPRAQGAILGKAMSALPGGKGLVLVLVSLQ